MWKLLRAGLLAGLIMGRSATAVCAVDPEAIDQAIERGVQALRDMQAGNGTWPQHEEFTVTQIGATALAGLTLLECGAEPDDQAVLRAAEVVRKASINLTHIYSIALAIIFFDRLGDPGDIPLIESLTVRMLAGQTSTGGWNYYSPPVGEAEERRLQTKLASPPRRGGGHGEGRRRSTQASAIQRTAKDLPKEIRQQLALLKRTGGLGGMAGSDNSNTQFATLALWVARRYGFPVEHALKRVEARFRTTQHPDGGWGYFDPNKRVSGPMADSTASMTCAGLLGLAIAHGKTLETMHARQPGAKSARDVNKDIQLRKGLMALSMVIGQPHANKGRRRHEANSAPQAGGRTYYFLWSLERVGVALDLQTIGKKDWYAWGAEILLANQQADGTWQGNYAACGADTCFALLFLKRANLAPDLTRQLTGRWQDPGQRLLKGGEAEPEIALEKTRNLPSGIEGKNAKASVDGRYPDTLGKNHEPRPLSKPLPAPPPVSKSPSGKTPAARTLTSTAGRMADDLAKSTGSRFTLLLHNLTVGKGAEFTEALALAIPQLDDERQRKARQSLIERLTRMTDATLFDYLADEELEIRLAAAHACAAKGSKTLIPRLIPLVLDKRGEVTEAAYQALKQLSGQDFGPKPGAGRDERLQAARHWRAWWNHQQDKKDARHE